MRKASFFIIAILSILLSSNVYQILIYKSLVPILSWSIDSLDLNVAANRDAWRACKKFNWCEERNNAPKWPIIWSGEYSITV